MRIHKNMYVWDYIEYIPTLPLSPKITFTLQSFYGTLGAIKLWAALHPSAFTTAGQWEKPCSSLPSNEDSATPSTFERTTPSVALIRHKGEFWEERSDNHTPPILLHTTSTAHIFFEDARKYAAKAFVDAYSIIVPHYPANLGAVGSYELRVNFQLR